MLKFKSAIISLAFGFLIANVNGLPSYIKRCSRSDAKIDECIKDSAQDALITISKGDPQLQIPNLLTLNPENQNLVIDNYHFDLKNIQADSSQLKPTYAHMNFETMTLQINLQMPYLAWLADFEASGSIRDHTIHESGKVNITFDKLEFKYTKHLGEVENSGKKILQITSSEETQGNIDKLEFVAYNHLSQGQPLNDDEKQLFEEITPKIKEAVEKRLKEICGVLVTAITNVVLSTAKADEVFLP